MKKFIVLLFLSIMIVGCDTTNPDEEGALTIDFIVDNDLLWNISHNYKVSGIDANGKEFMSQEKDIKYFDILLEKKQIQKNSKLKVYRDGSVTLTSDPITSNGIYTFHDTPYGGGDYISKE